MFSQISTSDSLRTEAPSRIVVLLHGYGASGDDLRPLAEAWHSRLPSTLFITPNAPELCEDRPSGYQWFPLYDFSPSTIKKGLNILRPQFLQGLHDLLNTYGLSPKNLALVGFSQGAMVALDIGVSFLGLGCIISYSGFFSPCSFPTAVPFPPEILLIHGKEDTVVPYKMMLQGCTDLSACFVPYEIYTCENTGHTISEEGLQKGGEFLVENLAAANRNCSSQNKIALVGAGQIGGCLAHLILQRRLGEVSLIDIDEGTAKGKALDLRQACAVEGIDAPCWGGRNEREGLEGASVVVVTAGTSRKPGMDRDALFDHNAKAMAQVGKDIKKYCPKAFVVVVTNPLDMMSWVLQHASALPSRQVVGMAGTLDSGRFRLFLADALGVNVCAVQTLILGSHGDGMLPLINYTTVSGIPLSEWIRKGRLSHEEIQKITKRTREGGAEIVSLLQKSSAHYAPALSAFEMVDAYLKDKKCIIPCSAWLQGEYGIEETYLGVPVLLGKGGVEKIIELSLTAEEEKSLRQSAEAVRSFRKRILAFQ